MALAAARGADAHELAAHVAADHAQAELGRAHQVLAVATADVRDEGVRAQALEERLWARPCLSVVVPTPKHAREEKKKWQENKDETRRAKETQTA